MLKIKTLCFVIIAMLSPSVLYAVQQHDRAQHFDTFGEVTAEDLTARMDNFAIALESNPTATGYIIAWGPEGSGSGTAEDICALLKQYLVDTRRIDERHVVTRNAGRYKNPEHACVELWLVPEFGTPPDVPYYNSKLKIRSGKYSDEISGENLLGAEGEDIGGIALGYVRLAAFGDMLRSKETWIAYIVSSQVSGGAPGAWKRVSSDEAEQLSTYGIDRDRIKIIHGETLKSDDEVNGANTEVRMQLWMLPATAPAPAENVDEPAIQSPLRVGTYSGGRTADELDRQLKVYADMLAANREARICLVVRPPLPNDEPEVPAESPNVEQPASAPTIDSSRLVEYWMHLLTGNYSVSKKRIVVLEGISVDYDQDKVDIWLVPPGADVSSLVQPPEPPPVFNEPPIVSLAVSTPTIEILCVGGSSQSCSSPNGTVVDLTANATYSEGEQPLKYIYTTKSGRVDSQESNAKWDLSGLAPGKYEVTVEVDRDDGAVSFSTAHISLVGSNQVSEKGGTDGNSPSSEKDSDLPENGKPKSER